jgi:Carboxypeptidase regulatory-like domain
MKRGLLSVAMLLFVLTAAQHLAAQRRGGGGVVSGVVLGPDDKPASHASVTYQSSGGTAPHAVHTDSQGHFTITKLRTDNYDLRASGKGVFSEWEKNVAVRSGQTKSVTLRLIYAKDIPKSYTKSKGKE